MPRGIELHIPFPRRISRDVLRARHVCLQWPGSFGLLDTPAAQARHLRADYAQLASRFHPMATGADLDLGVDQMSWFFLFDDLFDGPLGKRPDKVSELVEVTASALRSRLPASAPMIAHAFADLWQRTCHGMSRTWQLRSATHWQRYLIGYCCEAELRVSGRHANSAEHLRLRRDTIGVQPTLDMAERVGHFEVPSALFDAPELVEMRGLAAEVTSIHNDICSVEKEEAAGDVHNLVFILQREQGISRDEAVADMSSMLARRVTRFLELEAGLPGLCARLGLCPTERDACARYDNDALRTVMRGDFDWAEESGRYDHFVQSDTPTVSATSSISTHSTRRSE
jgi:pentalenene synthase